MTLVVPRIVVEIGDGLARELSYPETASIVNEMVRMFGEPAHNSQAFQALFDRYCQRKGRKPLLIIEMAL